MDHLGTWTAAELRDQGLDVGVNRAGAVLRVDCRPRAAIVDEVFVARLVGLDRIRELNLAGCVISDRAASDLRRLESLRTLNLDGAQLSGAAIEQLAELPELELLVVRGTGIESERLADLRRRRLRIRIVV